MTKYIFASITPFVLITPADMYMHTGLEKILKYFEKTRKREAISNQKIFSENYLQKTSFTNNYTIPRKTIPRR